MTAVLLVDDDAIQLKLCKLRLRDAGFEVRTASGAHEALSLAREAPPDAILSDVLMGEVDGFGFCRMLQSDAALANVPVILLSSHYGGHSDQQLATRVGARELVMRSPTFEAELEALQRSLSSRSKSHVEPSDTALYEDHLRSNAIQLHRLIEQMRNAEHRYRTLFDHANDTITILSAEGIIIDANDRWRELLGVPTETLVGRHFSEFIIPIGRDANLERFRLGIEAGEGWAQAVTLEGVGGKLIHMEFSANTVEFEGRTIVMSIGRDVTRQIEATQRVVTAEEKYRSLVERLPDVIWTCAGDGSLTFVTPNAAKVIGHSPEELRAQDAEARIAHVHPDDRKLVAAAFEKLLGDGTLFDVEYRRKHKDGRWIWIRNRAIASYERDGRRFVDGMITDVTERRALEDSLHHAQKMEAIGLLTGGIAHDFNNILAVILANSHFLLETITEPEARADVEGVRVSAERAAALTRQLLAFSRRQVLEPSVVKLDGIVGGVEKMLQRLIGEDVELSVRAGAELGTTRVDAGQIEQVIMNLAVNARDAMPHGGRLSIETANVDLSDVAAAKQVGGTPGRYVVLSVTDDGTGMDEPTKLRIFEPFFTTKEKGRGTGLGLSTCYGIVKQSGGFIEVQSEVGRGTSFKVYLPRVDEEPIAPAQSTSVTRRGSETILLVEDDVNVRNAVRRMLTSLGYRVLAVRNGDEAVEVAQRHGAPIDAVLSDVILPLSDGPEVVARIRQQLGPVPALFMSGYTDHAIFRSERLQPDMHFLQKPFTPAGLAAKLHELIDAS